MSRTERLIIKSGSVVRETASAWLAEIDGLDDPIWFPKSQVEFEDGHAGGEFHIPEWLAKEKDLT